MSPSLSIPFSAITEGDRARDEKKYGNLDGLIASLQSLGTIQPIVLSKSSDSSYLLVAGGRRYRAMQKMGVTELYHGSTLTPTRLGFVFADDVPEHQRREAELDENLHRLDMDWVDNCLLIADVFESKRRDAYANGKRWGDEATAALLGPGYSKTSVNYARRIADLLRKKDAELLSCTTMQEAIGVLLKRKVDEGIALLQKKAAESTAAATAQVAGVSTESFLDSLNVTLGNGGGRPESGNNNNTKHSPGTALGLREVQPLASPQTGPQESTPPAVVALSTMFRLGKMEEVLPTFPGECFDHIVTDIPYGIDMDNLSAKGLADVKDEHEVEANLELMPVFLARAFRVLKPSSFCVFFYDLDHHEKLQSWAEGTGFAVQRWPLIIHKTSPCRNQAASFNTTKNYEAAMVLRKGTATLRKPQPSSVWSGDFSAERALYNNKFAKPFELWRWIYDMIAFPGQSILDPFCGEMSGPKAALNCGLVPFGVECNEIHYNRGLEHIRKAYKLIHKDNVTFV